jgi:C4-dicarboxylate-specific signal transduction histidine kinase
VREVAYLYQTRDRHSNVELDLDPQLQPVTADAIRLRQLLHNLIRNALEALEGQSGAQVVIRTEVDAAAQLTRVSIEDNGPVSRRTSSTRCSNLT